MSDVQREPGEPKMSRIFDRRLAVGSREKLGSHLIESMSAGTVSAIFCNVHMLMLSRENARLARAMEDADWVIPDGVPVAWLQRRLGYPGADVLRGYEAVQLVCSNAAASSRPVGFLGSTADVLAALKCNLEQQHPGLLITYIHAPAEIGVPVEIEPALIGDINAQGLFCLFVGLGCPKQETWVSGYRPHLNCSLLAVGAAFDWLAGTTRKPPAWMEKSGLGWLHRLAFNPRRMWYRYLKYNSKFIFEVAKPLIFKKPAQTTTEVPKE